MNRRTRPFAGPVMRRLGRVGWGGALLIAAIPRVHADEALVRGDRQPPTAAMIEARVEEAFAVQVPQTRDAMTGLGERSAPAPAAVAARVEDAFVLLRSSATPATPIVVASVAPAQNREAAPAPSGGGGRALGFAASGVVGTAGLAALDRLVDRGPTVVAVPLPRKRPPAPKTAETQVASLESDIGMPAEAPREEASPILADTTVTGEPRRIPREAHPYLALLRREAAANDVPLWLAVGVGWVESKYQAKLRGTHGVVGIMQVMPSTARYQGYQGPIEKLLEPETNIVWGMKELGWNWRLSRGDPCLTVAKYTGGVATKRISPAAASYCHKVKTVTGMI